MLLNVRGKERSMMLNFRGKDKCSVLQGMNTCRSGEGHALEDVTKGQPVGDVEKDEGAGEHYPRHSILQKKQKQ